MDINEFKKHDTEISAINGILFTLLPTVNM